jgi:endonuclease I
MFKSLLITSILFTINLNAQVYVSADSILFPQIFTGSSDSISFHIKNFSSQAADIKINNLKNVYNISDTLLSIPSNDSSLVWIKYQPDQNVIDNDLILITSNDSTIGSIISLTGSGKFGDSYDATTFNLYDTQLKSALTQLVNNHTSLGYNLARDKMFMEIDNQKVNGQGAPQNTLECVYTGRQAIGYTSRTDAQNNYNFNTEHTWPQSNFGEDEPMKSDLFHLYPTDNPANGIRANYPFGNVVSNVTWDSAGSKLGRNSLNQIVFEPRDVHKGDVSRSMFYFITRYPVNYGGFFTQIQENVFREWNELDTVGAVESARNNAIALLQLKRNPFIDHPEFVDRVYSFTTNNIRATFAELKVLPLKVDFDSTLINNTISKQIYVANSGSAQLIIDSIAVTDSRFSLNINGNSIEPYSSKKVFLKFNPDSIKNYNASISVYSNGGVKEVVLTGIGKDNTVDVDNEINTPLTYSLKQNYPNPFNPSTNIRYAIGDKQLVYLKVYDILGKEIAILVNEEKSAGSYQVNFDASRIPSGVYFYRLQTGSFVDVKKMIYLK